MKLVLIFGSGAVGKMTVGQALAAQTGLRLFHNHAAIEPVISVMGYYDSRIIQDLREVIFQAFSKSSNYGMIFTFMWAFDMQEDWEYVTHVADIFKSRGSDIYYVELTASQEIRLQRNETPNRLANKPSKQDISRSRQRIIHEDAVHRLISRDGELPFENYIRIDNTNLSPEDAASIIRKQFQL